MREARDEVREDAAPVVEATRARAVLRLEVERQRIGRARRGFPRGAVVAEVARAGACKVTSVKYTYMGSRPREGKAVRLARRDRSLQAPGFRAREEAQDLRSARQRPRFVVRRDPHVDGRTVHVVLVRVGLHGKRRVVATVAWVA